MVRELVEKFAPGFVKSILPVNQLPQMSKAVGLGSWAAVGGVFAFFLVQDPAFHYFKDLAFPPPETEETEDK